MTQQFSDKELRKRLTPEQYHVLREKGTEPPFSGKLLYNKEQGVYACAVCSTPLFDSSSKYESTQLGLEGWPSFDEAMANDKLMIVDDYSWGMHRKEVNCATCGSHLGHYFPDDSSPTGQHYCINSAALDFEKKA